MKNAALPACAAALLVLGLAACQSPTAPPGQAGSTPRYHNWWNYYDHGLRAMDAGDYRQAREDFECALGVRPGAKFGRPGDTWRARLYGMHFVAGFQNVEGYFPRRELGISLLHLGEFEAARACLEQSLQETSSARAKYFLNLVHAKLVGATTPPPEIVFQPDSETRWTALRRRPVAGQARGPGYVADVEINGQAEFIELAESSYPFQQVVALHPGTNRVSVKVRDLAGHIRARELVWVADWMPPAFQLHRLTPEGAGWRLEGACVDDGALRRVTLGGRTLYERPGLEERAAVAFATTIAAGPQWLEAEDLAGNQLRLPVDAKVLARSTPGTGWSVAWAAAPGGGTPDVGPGAGTPVDTFAPDIRLDNPARLAVVGDECLLSGWAEDQGIGLSRVWLQGASNRWGLAVTGQVAFACRALLAEGTNHLEIVAEDRAGNRATRAVEVIRLSPLCLDESIRLSLAMPPPDVSGEKAYAAEVTEAVMDRLTRAPLRFHLVERSADSWEKILLENRIGVSDLVDRRFSRPVGTMVAADLLLLVQAFKRDQGHELVARVIETSGGNIMCSARGEKDLDVYDAGHSGSLQAQAHGLVLKIKQRFPLLECRVIEGDGDRALIDAGADEGVPEGARFVVLEGEQGERLREAQGEVFQMVTTAVDARRSRAKAFVGGKKAVRPGDRVFTR